MAQLNKDRWTAVWIRIRIDHRKHLKDTARQLKIPLSTLLRIGLQRLVEDEKFLEEAVVHYRTVPEA